MAWIKCKKCDRRVSDKKRKCPRCGALINKKEDTINYVDMFKKSIFIIIELLLMWFVVTIGREILFSGDVKPLILLLISVLLLIVSTLLNIKYVLKDLNRFCYILGLIMVTMSFGISISYGYKSIMAFEYENNLEIYNLASKYSVNDAKKIKNKIDKIFEIDDDISVRNVTIGNFYKDDDKYILYLDDFYGNYRLKFYILMDENNINDIYWLFNDHKIYLVKDGKKSKDFSYYYAMYIVENLMGEDIKGLARIEEDVEKIIKKKFDNCANAMISYDEFIYDDKTDSFKYKCVAQNMDYYGDIVDEKFTISFDKLDKAKSKKIWYYGDAAFDYVNWNIKF